MSTAADFSYGPRLQGRTIRLVEVKLNSGRATLEINLLEHALGTVKYKALSYVWGEQASKEQIECNGRLMHIGSNLLDALTEWARRRLTGLIWADAICINQDDVVEKTDQVRMMHEIYKEAQRVIIWLGKEQARDQAGFKLAKSLYQKVDKALSKFVTSYHFENFDCESKEIPAPYRSQEWASLFEILGHPWFSRIWVVQELLVAQKSVMWRGSLRLNTTVLLWATIQIAHHKDLYESFDIYMGSPPSSALVARNIATGYLESKTAGRRAIYDTLSRYSSMKSSDNRDRYFALAGISAGLDAGFVDYQKSYREVACLVGKMTLLGSPGYLIGPGGTAVLAFTEQQEFDGFPIDWLTFHANPQNHTLGLPSWVPDLTSPHSPGFILSGLYNTKYLRGYKDIPLLRVRSRQGAHCEWSGSSPPRQVIPIPDEIDILGAVFDRVKTLAGQRPPFPRLSLEEHQRFIQDGGDSNILDIHEGLYQYETKMVYWLSQIRTLADPTLCASDSIMSGSPASFDAFWRTLVYDREPPFDVEFPNKKPENTLGISFGCWYLQKKLTMKRLWQQNVLQHAVFSQFLQKLARPFDNAEGAFRHARRFFVSAHGRLGWVPFRTEVGDQVCVLRGMRVPVIMRSCGARWEFIGPCYVHKFMDGETWDLSDLQWGFMSFV